MAEELSNSPLAGDALVGGWSPAVAGADAAKHNTAAAAVASATEAKPRLDILDFIGCFLANFGRFLEVLGPPARDTAANVARLV